MGLSIDRDKVITGLECCQKTHCDKCPYVYDGLCNTDDCTADLASDVLELLKWQEAEIDSLNVALENVSQMGHY